MADDERRAEIEAVWDYLIAHTGEPGIIDGQWREGPAAQVIGLIAHALDRVRDARGDDEATPDRGDERDCPDCNALGECTTECRPPQGEDHEAGIEALNARQDAVQALLGVLNDIGGGNPWNFNVITEAAEDAWDAAIAAYLSHVSPSRDGTVAVERLRDQLATMTECLRIYVQMRDAGTPARPGWLEEEIPANDAFLAELARPATGEQTDHGGNQDDERRH